MTDEKDSTEMAEDLVDAIDEEAEMDDVDDGLTKRERDIEVSRVAERERKAEELSKQAEELIRDAQDKAAEILKDIKRNDTTEHAAKSDDSAPANEKTAIKSEPKKQTKSKTKKTEHQSS